MDQELSVRELANFFLNRHSKVFKKSWQKDELYIKSFILPIFGSRDANSLKRGELELWHKSFNGKFMANRVLSLMSAIYNKGIDWELVDNNPAKRIKKFPEKARDLFIPREKVAEFFEEVDKCPPYFEALIKFCLLTGVRKKEVLSIRWDDITYDSILVKDRKNNRDLRIPITDNIRFILEHRKVLGEYIFTKDGKRSADCKRPWAKLRQNLKNKNFLNRKHLKFNDLRRTVGSWLGQNGANSKLIAEVLGQVDLKSTERYIQFQYEHRKAAMENLPIELKPEA